MMSRRRRRHDPLHQFREVYVTRGGIAVEMNGRPFPHRPRDVGHQRYRNYVRWLERRRRKRGG